jgi:hypothetical protein
MRQEYPMNEVYGFAAVIVTIFVGMLFNNNRFSSLESRMDKMNSDLTGRMDKMNSDLTGRIDKMRSDLNGRIDRMESDLNMRLDRQQADLSQFYETLGRHDAKIEMLEKKAS